MIFIGDLSPGLSSCSITSGTPSTDARFSEFHLDKVASYFTPSDDDIIFNVRQTRAYSTGSKPDVNHNKFVRYVDNSYSTLTIFVLVWLSVGFVISSGVVIVLFFL